MSELWINTLRQYVASRFPLGLYGPCAALLVTAGLAGGRVFHALDLAMLLPLALTLLFQFRLLDDVSDLLHDRRVHPDRVLVRAASLNPFVALFCVSCIFNTVLLALQDGSALRFGVFVALTAAYLLWYRFLRKVITGKIIGYHFVAAKYPTFVYLLSGDAGDGVSLALSMALVFLTFSIYEVLHDRTLQVAARADTVMRLEIGALFAVSGLMTFQLLGSVLELVALQGLLGVISVAALAEVFARRRIHLQSAKASYLVFAVAFALSVTFSLGVRL